MGATIVFSSLLLLATIFLLKADCSPITQVGEHEFVVKLAEEGTAINQTIRFVGDNIAVYHVPARNGRMKTTFVRNTVTGLEMSVDVEANICLVYKAAIVNGGTLQEEYLREMAAQKEAGPEILEVNHDTGPVYSSQTITGPEIYSACLPRIFRQHIPQGCSVHIAKQIVEFKMMTANDTSALILDETAPPAYQGDDINGVAFKDVLEILPRCNYIKRRVKRWGKMGYDREDCYIPIDGQRVMANKVCLAFHPLTCRVCSQPGYDCSRRTPNGQRINYSVKCFGSDLTQGKCLAHVMSVNNGGNGGCQPCCFDSDCGARMPRCGKDQGSGGCSVSSLAYDCTDPTDGTYYATICWRNYIGCHRELQHFEYTAPYSCRICSRDTACGQLLPICRQNI